MKQFRYGLFVVALAAVGAGIEAGSSLGIEAISVAKSGLARAAAPAPAPTAASATTNKPYLNCFT
ncbi:MAG: hypothetical protein AAFX40_18245, partial [Cyanobacteria bacterium J06639_1]